MRFCFNQRFLKGPCALKGPAQVVEELPGVVEEQEDVDAVDVEGPRRPPEEVDDRSGDDDGAGLVEHPETSGKAASTIHRLLEYSFAEGEEVMQ